MSGRNYLTKRHSSKILKVYPTDYAKKKVAEQVDFVSAYLANVSDDAIVFLAGKAETGEWLNEGFKASKLRKTVEERAWSLRLEGDVFISANSFCDANRLIGNVYQFQNCFLDLDYRKRGKTPAIRNMTDSQIADLFLEKCEKRHIPKPSFLIHTGNGLHAWWQLEPLGSNWRQVWDYLQRSLQTIFADFGADANCLDAARVLRIPGTLNRKDADDKKKVTVVYRRSRLIKASSLYNGVNRYQKERNAYAIQKKLPKNFRDMEIYQILKLIEDADFCTQYGVTDWLCPVKFQETQSVQQSSVRPVSYGEKKEWKLTTAISTRWKREVNTILADLERLVELRKGKMCGYRNVLLFEYYSYLCFVRQANHTTHEERVNVLLRLNNTFEQPLPVNEVLGITRKPIRYYRVSKEVLIQKLGITVEEQLLLTLLHNDEVKLAKRRSLRPSRRQNRENKIQAIADGLIEGLSVDEIAAKIKTSGRTVYNYIKQYNLRVEAAVYCSKNATVCAKENGAATNATAGFAKHMLDKVAKSTRNRTKQKRLDSTAKAQKRKNKKAVDKSVLDMEKARLYLSATFSKVQSLLSQIELDSKQGNLDEISRKTRLIQNLLITMPRVAKVKRGRLKSSIDGLSLPELLQAFRVVEPPKGRDLRHISALSNSFFTENRAVCLA